MRYFGLGLFSFGIGVVSAYYGNPWYINIAIWATVYGVLIFLESIIDKKIG